MNTTLRSKLTFYLVNALIIAVFVLAIGIRGAGNWHIPEYVVYLLALSYTLYLRHKKPQPKSQVHEGKSPVSPVHDTADPSHAGANVD